MHRFLLALAAFTVVSSACGASCTCGGPNGTGGGMGGGTAGGSGGGTAGGSGGGTAGGVGGGTAGGVGGGTAGGVGGGAAGGAGGSGGGTAGGVGGAGGGTVTSALDCELSDAGAVSDLKVVAGRVHWATGSPVRFRSMAPDGGARAQYGAPMNFVSRFAVTPAGDTILYGEDSVAGSLRRLDLPWDGGVAEVASFERNVVYPSTDGVDVYWVSQNSVGTAQFSWASLVDGGTPQPIVVAPDVAGFSAVDPQYVYVAFFTGGKGKVVRYDRTLANPFTVIPEADVPATTFPRDLAIDGTHIYLLVADPAVSNARILRRAKDGTGSTASFAIDGGSPLYIHVSGNDLYWSQSNSNVLQPPRIWKMDKTLTSPAVAMTSGPDAGGFPSGMLSMAADGTTLYFSAAVATNPVRYYLCRMPR